MTDPVIPSSYEWPETIDPQLVANVPAERAILGLIMANPEHADQVVDQLVADDLYEPAHQTIYKLIRQRYLDGQPLDPVSISEALARASLLGRIGGGAYLHQLYAAPCLPGSLPTYIEIVLERALRRRLLGAHARAGAAASSPALTATEAMTRAQELLAEVEVTKGRDGVLVGDAVDDLLKMLSTNEPPPPGLMTGLADLDGIIQGSRPGNLVVVAGRQGSGKSTLLRDIARHLAIRMQLPTAFFSLEMNTQEIMTCLLSAHSGVHLNRLRNQRLTDSELAALARAAAGFNGAPLVVHDQADMSMVDIRAHARRQKRHHGLVAAIIDYVQLVRPDHTAASREQEVARISRASKLLAKEEEIVVFMGAQLNRGPEMRQDKRPQLSDIRESDAIAADADAVILVHRPDYYDPNDMRAGEADFIVAKHRHGKTGTAVVGAQLDRSRFVNLMAA